MLIHGFLASGDTYENYISNFIERGYCGSQLIALDWNTFDEESGLELLDATIQEVLVGKHRAA